VGGQSGVAHSIPAGQIVSGTPTMPHQTYLRPRFLIERLPEMAKQMRALEDRVRLLEAEKETGRKKDHGDE
jgi:UDP-3-O-[3-hydroxymyristoyl] glucosamine N-acyltransferase